MQFKNIPGALALKNNLIKMVKNQSVPHAQLFVGQEGGTALALSMAFAQYLCCENPSDQDSCGECSACKKNTKLIHPDVHFTYPVVKHPKINYKAGETAISIDWINEWRTQIKNTPWFTYFDWMKIQDTLGSQGNITARECNEILRKFSFKTYESKYKVIIVWLPEYLGVEGNKLLKFIEEPAEDSIILLVTENVDKILPTILSRTQLIQVPPLSLNELETEIKNNYNISSEQVTAICNLAEGSIKKAIDLAQNNQNDFAEIVHQWIEIFLQNKKSAIITVSDQIAKLGRENQKHCLQYALIIFRQALTAKFIVGKENENYIHNLTHQLSNRFSLDSFDKIQEKISKAIYYIERNALVKLTITELSINICNLN